MKPSRPKIRLVEPKPAGYHFFERWKLPRLGLPIMGAILRNKGYDVRIYCQDISEIDYADLLSSDLVGISTTTSTAPGAYQLAQRLEQHDIPVVLGGPHVSFAVEEALQYAPYCVCGEGEGAIEQLVERILDAAEPDGIPGVSYRWGGEIRHNHPAPLVDDLDSLPFPALELIEGHSRMGIAPVQTSRGCPFDCTFCSVTRMFGRRYRTRSVESVIEELARHGDRQVFFYDDNFTANHTRTKELCEQMIRLGRQSGWSAQARADVARDDELLALMKRSNCFILYIGFESVNPASLEAFHKRQSVGEIEECIDKLHRHGIMVHGMFITGADQDQPETIKQTVDFALRAGIDTVQFSVLTPIPGTSLYSQLDSEGRIFSKDWSLYDGHHVVFEPANLTPYALQRDTIKAMKRFYRLWQCIKLVCRLKLVAAFLRYYGHRRLKAWEKANRAFMAWVRSMSAQAIELARPKKTATDPK